MDSEMVYSIFGIMSLVAIVYLVFRNNKKSSYKTKTQKKKEIIDTYKKELLSTLNNLQNKELRVKKKSILLKKYSDELSQNIFFDKDEIREIILELAII